MLPFHLLFSLAGAIHLGSWDFQPWDNVAPLGDPTHSPLISSNILHGAIERRNLGGALMNRDTLRYWKDERGICRSIRSWRFGDSTTSETMELFGVTPGLDVPPPDSGRTSRSVDGQLREVGTLWSQRSGGRSTWIYALSPAPEVVHFDWDTTYIERDDEGRILSRREVWTDFAWTSDSISWAKDGSPSRWVTRSGGGWSDLVEIHTPVWSDARLIRDEVLSVTQASSSVPDTTSWVTSCTWIEDSLLRSCTTTLLRTNATQRSYRRRFDSLEVVREADGRARRLESFTEGQLRDLRIWDAQGRSVSRREIREIGSFLYLSLDSSRYGKLPWYEWNGYAYGSATSIFDQIPLEDITTVQWDLLPYALNVPKRSASNRVRLLRSGDRLHLRTPGSTSGFLRIQDPAGRVQERAVLHGGRASVTLPKQGGVWLWVLTDGAGQEIGRGRIAAP